MKTMWMTTIDSLNSRRVWLRWMRVLHDEAVEVWGDDWWSISEFFESQCYRNMEWCQYEIAYYEESFQRSLHLN